MSWTCRFTSARWYPINVPASSRETRDMSARLRISSPVRQNRYSGCPLHCSTRKARRRITRGPLGIHPRLWFVPNPGIDLSESLLLAGLSFSAEVLQKPSLARGREPRKMRSDEARDIRIAVGHSRWRSATSAPVDGTGQFCKALDRQFLFIERLKEASSDARVQRSERSTDTACQSAIARK